MGAAFSEDGMLSSRHDTLVSFTEMRLQKTSPNYPIHEHNAVRHVMRTKTRIGRTLRFVPARIMGKKEDTPIAGTKQPSNSGFSAKENVGKLAATASSI